MIMINAPSAQPKDGNDKTITFGDLWRKKEELRATFSGIPDDELTPEQLMSKKVFSAVDNFMVEQKFISIERRQELDDQLKRMESIERWFRDYYKVWGLGREIERNIAMQGARLLTYVDTFAPTIIPELIGSNCETALLNKVLDRVIEYKTDEVCEMRIEQEIMFALMPVTERLFHEIDWEKYTETFANGQQFKHQFGEWLALATPAARTAQESHPRCCRERRSEQNPS